MGSFGFYHSPRIGLAMTDGGTISEQPVGPNGSAQAEQLENGRLALEQRVRRLEDAVATLQDTHPLEERIVDRVSRRLKRNLKQDSASEVPEPGQTISAGRPLLPAALDLIRNKAIEAGPGSDTGFKYLPRPWILFETYAELRTMIRMFLDPRYRATWRARVIPVVLLTLILTSWIWLPGTMFLPTWFMTIVDKLIDLMLAYLAFKILVREARRYRELVVDLPARSADR
jgi:hypothetical protein